MKRTIGLIYAFFLLICLAFPVNAAEVTDIYLETTNEIHVEYMEFYNNQDKYKNLALQGNIIYIHVGEEYAELEKNRLGSNAFANTNIEQNVQPRYSYVPTATWDIHVRGTYHITVDAYQSAYYTNYKIYGCDAYQVDLFNEYESSSITYIPHGHSNDVDQVTIPPLTSVLTIYTMDDVNDHFYLGFRAPIRAYGWIKCVAE